MLQCLDVLAWGYTASGYIHTLLIRIDAFWVGFGFFVENVGKICVYYGICFDIDFDLLYADKDVVGKCDPLKAAYAALPAGNALVVRATARRDDSMGGSALFWIPKKASVRLALSASQLAFVGQVTAQWKFLGLNLIATLATGNYPRPFILGSATVWRECSVKSVQMALHAAPSTATLMVLFH